MGILTSSVKISLIDDVSKPARTVAQALRDAVSQMKNVNKAMGGSGSAMGEGFKKQLAGLNLTKKELAQVRLEWMKYAKEQRVALGDDWLKKNAAGVRAWKSQVIAATRAARREHIAEAKALAVAAKGGTGRAGGFMEGLGYGAPGMLGMYAGMGPKVVAGAGVAAAGAYGIKKAIDYEKAMVEVRKKVNLPAGVNMAVMEDMVDRTSLKVGIAREEVAGLVAQLGAAGVEYKDMQGMMDLTAKGAVAFDVPARDMAEYLAQIKAQTQWSTQEMTNFVDKVNMLADTGASSEKAIVEMFSRSAAAAKAASVPLDASLAALTGLNSIGMAPEVASRFWNAFTSGMRTLDGKGDAKSLKALGLSLQEVQKGMKSESTATPTLIKLLEALDKSPDKAAIAQALFGKQWWDEVARAGQALPEILKNLKNIHDPKTWKGSSGTALNMQLETSAAQLERLNSLVSQIGDKMMRWALPPLNAGIDGLVKQMEGLGRILDDLKSGKKLGPAIMDESNRQLGKIPYSDVFAKYKTPDLRPAFAKMGDEAFTAKAGKKKAAAAPQSPSAGPMGALGGMTATSLPAFAQMTVKPTIDTSGLDHLLLKAESAHVAVEGLNISVSPNVNVGSLDAAIAKGNQLLSILGAIGVAASNTSASVGAAAGRASTAAANMKTSAAVARNNYVDGGVQGGN